MPLMKKANLDRLKERPVRDGVRRKVFSGEGATLAWHTLDPGHGANPHSHPHEQIVYMVSGRVRFAVGDEETILGPGDMIVIPPGVVHWAETISEEPAVDLAIFSPKRDEYAAEEEVLP